MYIQRKQGEELITVVEYGLREERSQLLATGEYDKRSVRAQIETCRNQRPVPIVWKRQTYYARREQGDGNTNEYRVLILWGGTIFYTARAESEKAANDFADRYVAREWPEITKVIAFPATVGFEAVGV